MIDDQTLTKTIDDSPLTSEDKEHWKKLLPKLDENHRQRLSHSLSAKTEISRAITLIEKALKIISEAETDADNDMHERGFAFAFNLSGSSFQFLFSFFLDLG